MIYLNKKETIIIFGTSNHIKEIDSFIYPLKNKYDSISLNKFNIFYKDINKNLNNFWIWNDFGFYTRHLHKIRQRLKEYKILTTKEINQKELNSKLMYWENEIEKYKEGAVIPYYTYNCVKKPVQIERNNVLAMYKTTLHPAINFAIIEGYKNIILCGVELEENWQHFHGFNTVRPIKRINKMRELLYEFKKYINIYKTNSKNTLELEYIPIEKLI